MAPCGCLLDFDWNVVLGFGYGKRDFYADRGEIHDLRLDYLFVLNDLVVMGWGYMVGDP